MNQYAESASLGATTGAQGYVSNLRTDEPRPTEAAILQGRIADVNERLGYAANRIGSTLDRLIGPRPEAVGNEKTQGQPSAALHRIGAELDATSSLASRLLDLAERLEGVA